MILNDVQKAQVESLLSLPKGTSPTASEQAVKELIDSAGRDIEYVVDASYTKLAIRKILYALYLLNGGIG